MQKWCRVDATKQTLECREHDNLIVTYPVSTAANGLGERINSEQTPRGWHCIRAKIGTAQASNTVFVGRRPTGEIYTPDLAAQCGPRDWILTRILWLSGLEPGKNRLGEVDTMRRYIYFHGTPDSTKLGQIGSRGCIRMRNNDIIRFFDWVEPGTKVLIEK